MADDILARLRCSYADPPCEQCTFCAAAIQIEQLRAAGNAMAESLYWSESNDPQDELRLMAWNEARRG